MVVPEKDFLEARKLNPQLRMVTTRWVITPKDTPEGLKARLVLRGFQDHQREVCVRYSPTAQKESLRSQLVWAASRRRRVVVGDISTYCFPEG